MFDKPPSLRLRPSLSGGVYLSLVVALLLAPIAIALSGQAFYLDLLTRAIILALAVASLNLIVGGGLVSLGHAAYLGIGAYSVAIPTHYEIHHGMLHLLFAVGGSAVFALLTGAICLRTKGLYFILITLAFSQMLYFTVVSLDEYGADDGMVLAQRSQFNGWLDLNNAATLYYFALCALLLFLLVMHQLLRAPFGRVIFGSKHNEQRMRALGFATYRYQLLCYVISGAVCGVAGFLLGNFTDFVSAEMMDWSDSADLLFMLIIGGVGALFGPIIGALAFLLLQEVLSGFTVYWQLIFGGLLIALVLLVGKDGLHGMLIGAQRKMQSGKMQNSKAQSGKAQNSAAQP